MGLIWEWTEHGLSKYYKNSISVNIKYAVCEEIFLWDNHMTISYVLVKWRTIKNFVMLFSAWWFKIIWIQGTSAGTCIASICSLLDSTARPQNSDSPLIYRSIFVDCMLWHCEKVMYCRNYLYLLLFSLSLKLLFIENQYANHLWNYAFGWEFSAYLVCFLFSDTYHICAYERQCF